MEQEDSDLLKKLGWTKEEANQFADKFDRMFRDAEQDSPRGDQAKQTLDETLRSLGLRPPKADLRRAEGTADQMGNLHEDRRFDPPAKWADWFGAQTRGMAREGK